MRADLIIHNAQLVSCASPGGPKRGQAMREVGLITNGAVAIKDGRILAVSSTPQMLEEFQADEMLDANEQVVCPGFVDAHTHLVYGGDRVDEFEMRIQGKSYLEIQQAGGGILSTVNKTRAANPEQLLASAKERLSEMLKLGTTTLEIKSGYGLDTATELKMLQVIEQLDGLQPVELIPTFLGAHSVPPEYKGRTEDYITVVIHEMLPAVASWYYQSSFAARGKPCFIDVFCEVGIFDADQTQRILRAGQEMGLQLKAHVDEFVSLGGATVAIELGATSIDHLDHTPPAELSRLANSETVAVIIPAVNFNLASPNFADARAMIDSGVAVALATDNNPGSAPCPSLPLVMAIACRYQHLLPAEALNACTINAAHALGLGGLVGSIEVDKQADLLLLNTADYRYLAYQFGGNLVSQVIKKGKLLL